MTTSNSTSILAAFLSAVWKRPVIMGVLNVTPDSFSDGGMFNSLECAVRHAKRLIDDGCDVLDIGGESTRPGATPVDEREEMDRVIPAIEAIAQSVRIPLSIDTYKASVAHAAISRGAAMVNDVWGLHRDPDMAAVVAQAKVAVVMMHNREFVDESIDILQDIRRFFDQSLNKASAAGIAADRIFLDPGIGFGKSHSQSLQILARLGELRDFGFPLVVGASRKGFIGGILGTPVKDRLAGTLAVNVFSVLQGASIVRVHDVREHRHAFSMLEALKVCSHA